MDSSDAPTVAKKQKPGQRACDRCRSRKVKCDGEKVLDGEQCSNCRTAAMPCTYMETAKKRGPHKGHVESLETRLQRVSSLLSKLCPGIDFGPELSSILDKFKKYQFRVAAPLPAPKDGREPAGLAMSSMADPRHDRTTSSEYIASSKRTDGAEAPTALDSAVTAWNTGKGTNRQAGFLVDEEAPIVHEPRLKESTLINDSDPTGLVKNLEHLNIAPRSTRFFGKSASILLMYTSFVTVYRQPGADYATILSQKRTEYWADHPWELNPRDIQEIHPAYTFPSPDLFDSLVDLYFEHVNNFKPLLHKPSFVRDIANGLHYNRNLGFGAIVLVVLSLGSRFLRIRASSWNRKASILTPQASSSSDRSRIRLGQDVGAHRRKASSGNPNREDESWKRAFWVLVSMDRTAACFLGRPPAIADEDIDLDVCIEVDDEYWEHSSPEKAFQQPAGKPSKVAYFNAFLRLNQIMALALRTLYSLNKSKVSRGYVGANWESNIVSELDSALNKWLDLIPLHLRWDPTRDDGLFLEQSISLYGSYHQLQILCHRPFVGPAHKLSALYTSSLAICANSARASAHIFDKAARPYRGGVFNSHLSCRGQDLGIVFAAAIALIMNAYAATNTLRFDTTKDLEDAALCMDYLKRCERRWCLAGVLWDILYDLISAQAGRVPQNLPTSKRQREDDPPPDHIPYGIDSNIVEASGAPEDILDSWFYPSWIPATVDVPPFDLPTETLLAEITHAAVATNGPLPHNVFPDPRPQYGAQGDPFDVFFPTMDGLGYGGG